MRISHITIAASILAALVTAVIIGFDILPTVRAEQTLQSAAAQLRHSPQSCLHTLRSMPPPCKERLQARRGLLMSEAAYRINPSLLNDSIANALADYYGQRPDQTAIAKAYLFQGVCAMQCGQHKMAAQILGKASAESDGLGDGWAGTEANNQAYRSKINLKGCCNTTKASPAGKQRALPTACAGKPSCNV